MLSEEDVRMLSPSAMTARHAALSSLVTGRSNPLLTVCFSQIPGRKEMGGREGWSRSLKRKLTSSAEMQD